MASPVANRACFIAAPTSVMLGIPLPDIDARHK
jgi:hypothetical protein